MNEGIFYADARAAIWTRNENRDGLFSFLKAHGIDGFQFSDGEIYAQGEDELLAAMKRHGMKTYMIHVFPRLMAKDDDVFENAVKETVGKLAQLKKFDCGRLMIVPFPKSDVSGEEDAERAMARMIDGLRRIIPEAKKEGIECYVENFSTTRLPYGKVDDVRKILDAVPEVKYVFDTANYFCIDIDPHAAYERFRGKIDFVHVKNFKFCAEGMLLDNGRHVKSPTFDTGPMNITALFEKMAKDRLDVPYVIELNDTVSLDDIARDAAVMKRYFG